MQSFYENISNRVKIQNIYLMSNQLYQLRNNGLSTFVRVNKKMFNQKQLCCAFKNIT